MKPRELQRMIHDLGFTTNTAKVKIPDTEVFSILVDLNENPEMNTEKANHFIHLLLIGIQKKYPDLKSDIICEWVRDTQFTILRNLDTGCPVLSCCLETNTYILTIIVYNS